MGEARRRGTYEERRATAIERNGVEREQLRRQLAEKRAAEAQLRQELLTSLLQAISDARMAWGVQSIKLRR